jgi:hypothetical protein
MTEEIDKGRKVTRRFGANLAAPHRSGAMVPWFQPDREDATPHNRGILARREVRAGMNTAGPKVCATNYFQILDPALHRQPRGFRLSG